METYIGIIRFVCPVFVLLLTLRCVLSLIRNRPRVHTLAKLVNKADNSVIDIDHWETSIGRSKSCDITFDYATVSRFHGVLAKRKQGWVVFDTFSKTGIMVNDETVSGSHPLEDGDLLAFGTAVLQFRSMEGLRADQPEGRQIATRTGMPVLVDGQTGAAYPAETYDNAIGRDNGCEIKILNATVSRTHARLYRTRKGWTICDSGSTSGTFLNGKPLNGPTLLQEEDRITVGSVTLIFYAS